MFLETIYGINNYKIKDKTIVAISDLHYSQNMNSKKLIEIIDYVRSINPDYVLFNGDLIDCVDEIEFKENLGILKSFLSMLASGFPVLLCIGNHDIVKHGANHSWMEDKNNFFKQNLDKINNLYILDNDIFEDEFVRIVGLTLPFDYYYGDESRNSLNNLYLENFDLINNASDEKLNIILIHDPTSVLNYDVINLEKYDIISTGHMHEGCMPFGNGTWGIIEPGKELFPKVARNTLLNISDNLLIAGALTTLAKSSGVLQYFNFIYPSYIEVIKYDKENNITRKRMKK